MFIGLKILGCIVLRFGKSNKKLRDIHINIIF
nr:MAG TPA: hypothetical protein [Caudoviricetes sp.]